MTEVQTKANHEPPLTDSPWFWAYLFCTGGLVALFLMSPRYNERQPQIERQMSARQAGGQAVSGESGPVRGSTDGDVLISLRPLYGILAILLSGAWFGLWYQRFRVRRGSASQKLRSNQTSHPDNAT